MRCRLRWLCLVGVLLIGCGGGDDNEASVVPAPTRLAADSTGAAVVRLDTAELRRLDLATVVLAEARWSGEQELVGELVTDPSRTSMVRSAVAGRLVAPAWPEFGAAVAPGQELGTVGDARPISAARAGRVTQILAQPGELVQAGQPLLELSDLDHPVVRLVWLSDVATDAPTLVRLEVEGGRAVSARLIGPAATVDSLTRRPALLYRAERTWPGARPGLPVAATYDTRRTGDAGVRVPAEAVVQWDGLSWVYVVVGDGAFARRRIETERPLEGGWFAARGFRAGDRVVTRGAQALLSEEFRARISVGDESDK